MANYTMPPRRKPSDYTKGRLTQDEIIALQIANDANISKARKAIKNGEPPQLLATQTMSPDELIADDAAQEAAARTNLEKLGFRPQEAAAITTEMRADGDIGFVSFNRNYPAIEADIKKRFNPKLLTPAFFIEYFRNYNNALDGANGIRVFQPFNGGLNGMINNMAELRNIIPPPAIIMEILGRAREQYGVNQEIIGRLNQLAQLLPTEQGLRALENLDPVRQQVIIDQLLEQFRDLPPAEEFMALRGMIRGDQIDREDFRRQMRAIVDAIPQGRQVNIVNAELGLPQQQQPIEGLPVAETLEEAIARRNAAAAVGRPAPVQRPQVAIQWLGDAVTRPDEFQAMRIGNKKAFLGQVGLSPYLRDANGDRIYTANLTNANWPTTNAMDLVIAWLTLKGQIGAQKIADAGFDNEFRALVGQGIKPMIGQGVMNNYRYLGNGINPAPRPRVIVGRGIAVKETPSYKEYGKYAIHIPQLEQQDILNIKYKSLGQVPKFKPFPVSDIFRDFILDLLENGKPNSRVYHQIAPEERKVFEEMSIGAGVWNGLGLKRTTTSDDEEEAKRFELLKGEYLAGNNNQKVISELRRLVVKMMSDGRIRKAQGLELLMELSI